MKIVQQSHEWITPLNRDVTLPRIEQIARTCYKSEGAIKPGSAEKMVAMLCKNHHYAMIEHISLSIKFVTDRGVANEIVRHRIGSYAQESTRYCNYSKDKFDNQITVIDHGYTGDLRAYWLDAVEDAETSYQIMVAKGATPEQDVMSCRSASKPRSSALGTCASGTKFCACAPPRMPTLQFALC